MTQSTNLKLASLNAFRAFEGKAPFADWRAARHQPMLDAYMADAAARDATAAADEFEATQVELAQQEGRPSTELEPGTYELQITDVEIVGGAVVVTGETESGQTVDLTVATEVAPAEKAPSYKDFANYDRSRIMKPVEFVHSFLDAHPDLTRKAAVQALVEGGVNYSTARTQYQRWFAKRK